MLGGMVSVTDVPPALDAATFWNVFGDMQGAEDDVAELMSHNAGEPLRTGGPARPLPNSATWRR